MSYTYDLYYGDWFDDPWTIATSGAREYGAAVMNHILDNGYEIEADLTDEEIEAFASELATSQPIEIETGNEGDRGWRGLGYAILPEEVSRSGYLKVLIFCRDQARRERES